MTLVQVQTSTPAPKQPVEYRLDPFDHTVVTDPDSMSDVGQLADVGQLSGQAIADAIPAEDWQQLRHAFFAAKAKVFAAIDCSREYAAFPFEDVEREGELVPLRQIIPHAPQFTLPAKDGRDFIVDEQYCVRPQCQCTETIIAVSSYCTDNMEVEAKPIVDFQVNWTQDHWKIAGESRPLTPAEEDLRNQLVATNPGLLAELRHRHEIMCKLYTNSAAVADRKAWGSAPVRAPVRIGRNKPCPCGSGKKYKRCCWLGGNAASE